MREFVSYIKMNFLPILMVVIPSGLFLGFMPFNSSVYYAFLIVIAFLAMIKNEYINITAVVFLIMCLLSIVFGNPSPIFRSWLRLGLFALLLIDYFPVFQSDYFDDLRTRSFPLMLIVMVITSVGSFVCFFFGINYMTKAFTAFTDSVTVNTAGWFGGLTYQSMMLGPICAISLTILIWCFIEKAKDNKERWLFAIGAFVSMCCMMLTASRGANAAGFLGTATILFFKYKKRFGKLLQVCLIAGIGAIGLSPLYMPYADKVLSKQRDNVAAGSMFISRSERWGHRLQEFSEYPIFGYGFGAVDTQYSGEYMPGTGIVEPGSSWLAILSMTGIAGSLFFLSMIVSTCKKLYREFNDDNDEWSLLHLGILAVFFIHFLSEGYVFSGGGALCFLFWFFFGCAYSYARYPIPYSLIAENEDERESSDIEST